MEEEKEKLIKKYANEDIIKFTSQYTNQDNIEEIKYVINYIGSEI